ncbi:MAG: hypothetical protein V7K40_16855 [Nostoc sp.]
MLGLLTDGTRLKNIANMDILSKGIARFSLSFGAKDVGLSVTLTTTPR